MTAQATMTAAPAWRLGHAVLLAIIYVALLLVEQPYSGVAHDARIYIGMGLAKLDPEGIGRDIMFAMDGQGEFSLFPLLMPPVVAALGHELGALVLSIGALGAWLAALALLASAIAPRGLRWAVLFFVLLLPTGYGGHNVLSFGEVMATPRPFAEAAALAAIAAQFRGRWVLSLGLLALSMALHPIMALPAAALVYALMCVEQRRMILLAPICTFLVVALGAAGISPADRLFQQLDAEWRSVLEMRSPYLFPTLWPVGDWTTLAVQVTTAGVAAVVLRERLGLLLGAALAICLAAMSAAVLLGDLIPSLLVVQLQLWRAQWLLALLASAALPLTVAVLLRQPTPYSRVMLAALAAMWAAPGAPEIVLPSCAVLSMLALARHRLERRIPTWLGNAALLYAGLIIVSGLASSAIVLVRLTAGGYAPPDLVASALLGLLALPLLAWAAVQLRRGEESAPAGRTAAGIALVLGALAVVAWQGVGRWPSASLAQMPAGEILWVTTDGASGSRELGDLQRWTSSGAPQWFSSVQGAGTVFSRDLALEWERRGRILVDADMAPAAALRPFSSELSEHRRRNITSSGLAAVCSAPHGPDFILVAGRAFAAPSGGVEVGRIFPPERVLIKEADGDYHWRINDRLIGYDCRAIRDRR